MKKQSSILKQLESISINKAEIQAATKIIQERIEEFNKTIKDLDTALELMEKGGDNPYLVIGSPEFIKEAVESINQAKEKFMEKYSRETQVLQGLIEKFNNLEDIL